jgi:hypothetical protein
MLQALARSVASIDERLVLLAPATTSVTNLFRCEAVDADRHAQLVRQVQRFRGRIYLQDGAVSRAQLSSDGRHQTPDDDEGWHMLLLDRARHVSACALYREHAQTVALEDLRVQHIPLTRQAEWRPKVLSAITDELARARRHHLRYVELGGWAVAPECRRTAGPLAMALAVYAFSRRAEGALGITTATFRHCSAMVLQRLGGSRLVVGGTTLPPYYDPRYRCMMEILRFDSRRPNPRFLDLIEQLRERLADVLVVTRPVPTAVTNPYDVSGEGRASAQPAFGA